MKLRFLGTGAADWRVPNEDGEYRRFTSTLIDDSLLIDLSFGALAVIPDGAKIENVLFTHSHADHFNIDALKALAPCTVYAHESWAGEITGEGLSVIPLRTGQTVQIAGFTVLPIPSNHSTERRYETTLHYLIEKDGKCLLYATDGAWLLNAEHRLIGNTKLDAAVFDATIGDGHDGDYRIFEHNSLEMVRLMAKTLYATGRLKQGAPIYLTHLARTLHAGQAELEKQNRPPFFVCHDGMEAEV